MRFCFFIEGREIHGFSVAGAADLLATEKNSPVNQVEVGVYKSVVPLTAGLFAAIS